jgi:hypothetical protein
LAKKLLFWYLDQNKEACSSLLTGLLSSIVTGISGGHYYTFSIDKDEKVKTHFLDPSLACELRVFGVWHLKKTALPG